MKNKRLTTFLLALATVLIWGIIIYQVFSKTPDTVNIASPVRTKNRKQAEEKAAYRLLENYPDPFFPGKAQTNETKPLPDAPAPVQPTLVWPDLKYNGFISSGEVVRAHVTIAGREMILKTDDLLEELYRVKTIDADSILIVKGNEKKWFKR